MNQTSTPQSPSNAATNDSPSGVTVGPTTLEERSAAAFGITPPETADDPASSSPALSTDGSPAASAGVDELAAARAARRAKLDQLAAEERARVDAQARHRESDELRKKLEDAEKRAAAAAGHIDPTKLTKEDYLALSRKLPNLSPYELGEFLREQMADPELTAARAVSAAVDPKLSALEQKLAAQQKVIDDFVAQQQEQRQQAEEAHYAQQLQAFTLENHATSPYAAGFLKHHGPQDFLALVQGVLPAIPAGAGPQAILDEIEERLTKIYAPVAGAPQQRAAPIPQPNPAAAKAPTTVSNTLAQTRASVVNEDEEWAALPFEERSARLFR